MEFNKSKDIPPLGNTSGNMPEHWSRRILSQDGTEASAYENYKRTKAEHMRELEAVRQAGQESTK